MSAQRVGNYEIVRLLARGGMSVVYLVRQPALDREVVLKRLDLESDDPTLARRFVGEAQLAATLDHPNIVMLLDFFEDDNVPYIAMEYVAGGSLRGLIGRLRPAQLFGVVEGILAGLEHAEQREIAHRDLKPENVLLTRRGTAKIADFGIARAYNSLTQRLTTSGTAIGTPAYMAPEQALNEPLGPYTDLYALGVMVYELLAGRPPFDAGTPLGVLYRHVHQPVPPLKDVVPRPQPELCAWVERLLAKEPAARPQSAREAWDALEELAVAELGPYWRRDAAIEPGARAATAQVEEAADTEPTTTLDGEPVLGPTRRQPTPTTPAPIAPLPAARPRRRRLLAAAGLALVGAGAAAYATLSAGGGPAPQRSHAVAPPPPVKATTPYDFDGDGRQELVVAFLRAAPRGSFTPSGVVLVHRGGRGSRSWKLISEADADIGGGRPRENDLFGSGLASADFDRDGNADLAIGTPGKDRVSVLYGRSGTILGGERRQFPGREMGLPDGATEYGFGLVARDLNHDGYDDLVVSAPGPIPPRPRTGALQILWGGKGGLSRDRARVLRRPEGVAGFGMRLRSGDLDGDGAPDLVEGAPVGATALGRIGYCPGAARGPTHCETLAEKSTTSSLGVGDVNGDGYDDIVQGDEDRDPLGVDHSAGLVRLWLGSRRGPRSPIPITQNSPDVPGTDQVGDRFGAVLAVADVDDDGYDDMLVSAVGEADASGRVYVIRGGPDGYRRFANSKFDPSSPNVAGRRVPDRQFGSTITALDLSPDHRLDMAVAARGAYTADDRVTVVEGSRGNFAPGETKTYTLRGASQQVRALRNGRIRLAAGAEG